MTEHIDPVTTEIIRNALISAAGEMNASLVRSAYSPVIYEAKDCSVGLFNEKAELLGQAAGLPIFLGNLGEAIKVTTDKYGLEGYHEGDVYILNDSYLVGTHLGDVTVLAPIFLSDELVGFAATRAHWIDVGAKDSHLPVDSTEIYQEGIRLGPTRLVDRGEAVVDVVDILALNSRFPQTILGDMNAQIAACRMGGRRYRAILERFGRDTVEAAAEAIFRQSERLDREAVGRMPDGEYFAEGCLDNDGQVDEPVWVRVKVVVQDTNMTIDLTGSSPQVKGCVNCGYAQTVSACRVAYKMLVNPEAAVSGGTFRPLQVIVPEGSFLAAREPAACQFYFTPLGLLIDLVVKALAPAMPQEVATAHYGDSMMLYLTHRDWVHADGHLGGWGAYASSDGENAICNVVLGDLRNFPVELTESKYPLQFLRYGLIPDTGGPGKFRGGVGSRRDIEVEEDEVVLSLWFERSRTPAWGLLGGKAGSTSKAVVKQPGQPEETMMKVSGLPIPRGTVTSGRAGGGGGYGPALTRDVALVREDLIDGYITREGAHRDYGVVFKPDSFEVDEVATARERSGGANEA